MVELDKHQAPQGNISVVEGGRTVPFSVRRVYYLYDVPGGESRGGHAHKTLSQLMVAVNGSFRVTLDDRPYQALYIKPGIWRQLDNFSSGAVCMVMASELYDEDDYIRDYDEFLKYEKIIS